MIPKFSKVMTNLLMFIITVGVLLMIGLWEMNRMKNTKHENQQRDTTQL